MDLAVIIIISFSVSFFIPVVNKNYKETIMVGQGCC